jgi:hypothetical protein
MLAIASATSFALGAAAGFAAQQDSRHLKELETGAGYLFIAGCLLIGFLLPGMA